MRHTRKHQRGGVHDPEAEFMKAIDRNDVEMVRTMLQDGSVNPASNDHDLFIRACDAGNEEIVKLLIEDERVDPGARNQLPLRIAVLHMNLELAKLLLDDPRVDPSKGALLSAVHNQDEDIIRLLLKDPRVYPGLTPLKAERLDKLPAHRFLYLMDEYQYKPEYFLPALDHYLDKAVIRQKAQMLSRIQILQNHNVLPNNITNTLKTYAGVTRNGKPITRNTLLGLKGNFYGPMRRNTRKNKKHAKRT